MIDLTRQLIELFNKEQMLAFFDFHIYPGGNDAVSGLCKISKPRGTDQQTQYVSLLFLIDTPDDAVWESVNAFIESIEWHAFEHELPGTGIVLSILHMFHASGMYFKETAIFLGNNIRISRQFVREKLYPAISRVMGLTAGELIFWEDLPETKQEIKQIALERVPSQSFVARLKAFLDH